MLLYITRPDWIEAFRSPAFCVILGRSQDLASVTSITEIELQEQAGAYLEHTLLPFSFRPYVPVGTTVLMPRWIEPPPRRRAHFERYIALHNERVFGGTYADPSAVGRTMLGGGDQKTWLVDPESASFHGAQRAVVLDSCA